MDEAELVLIEHKATKTKEDSTQLTQIKLETMKLLSVLKDVNEQYPCLTGSTDNGVRACIRDLRNIAYKAEDAIDIFVCKTAAALFVVVLLEANRAMRKLRNLMDEIRKVRCSLDEYVQRSNNWMIMSPPPRSQPCLLVDADFVIGIDQEIKRVVNLLIPKCNGQPPPVDRLAIVGMVGSGKTTLARSIYNHEAIKRHFNFQVWLSVSQGWDTSVLLLDILKQIGGRVEGQHGYKPGELAFMLNERLNKETCLLVLDDVWDFQSLQAFIYLIQADNYSNTWNIIITSRRNPRSKINWHIHQPKLLIDEDSKKLFSMVASNSSKPTSSECRNLPMKLPGNCDGLPLAIVESGRQLKKKNEGAESTSMYGLVNEILGLSYDQLPRYLKPCFLYLGLFPKGSRIRTGPLTRIWIAEGFIVNEAAARKCLQELIDHSMVQVAEKTCLGKPKLIQIHEMMRNFCIFKASKLDFLAVSSSEAEALGRTRRGAIDLSKSFILPANNPHLRSLVLLGQFSTNATVERYTTRHPKFTDICQMHKLRVLEIYGIKSPDGLLPKEIANLVHLRYLRIRSTNIRKLPKSVGKLRNLLTLDYWDVSAGTEVIVPNVLWKLEKLRHLYLPDGMSNSIEALRLDTLKDLITLWGVGGGYWLHKEMNRLSSTLCKLYIHGISTEIQLKAVLSSAAVKENSHLYALALNWYNFEFIISDQLSANMSLMRLKLVGNASDMSRKQGYKFPSNLRKLELHNTQLERPETMALLGELVFLKVLILGKKSYIGSEWNFNDQAFPVLEELKMADLPSLEKWEIENGAFQCLKKLSIDSCIKLKGVPEGLMVLETLNIKGMPYDFDSKYQMVRRGDESGGTCFDIIQLLEEARVGYFRNVFTFIYNLFFEH